MKRAVVVLALVLLAGCGGQSECSKLRTQAGAWARSYVAPLPQDVAKSYVGRLTASELAILADQHHVSCS